MAITEKPKSAIEQDFINFPIEEIKEYADTLLQVGNPDEPVPLNNIQGEKTNFNQQEILTTGFHYKHNLEDLHNLLINSTLKEEIISEEEIEHLESQHEKLNSEDNQICGHVFTEGELVYTCQDCSIDPTCCFCEPCFLKSIHVNCNHTFHASQGSGGCCDCGDEEAWTSGFVCDIHKAKKPADDAMDEENGNSQTDSEEIKNIRLNYEAEVRKKVKPFFKEIFKYVIEVLQSTKQMHKRRYNTFKKKNMQDLLYEDKDNVGNVLNDDELNEYLQDLGYKYPDWLKNLIKEKEKTAYMLYNNERHNYDEVESRLLEVNTVRIENLRPVRQMTKEGANKVAIIIDTIGRVPIQYSDITQIKEREHVAKAMQMPDDKGRAIFALPNIRLLHANTLDPSVSEKEENTLHRMFLESLYAAYEADQYGTEGQKITKENDERLRHTTYSRSQTHRPFYVLKVIETPLTVLAHQEVAIQLIHLLIKLMSDEGSSSPVYRDAISELILEHCKDFFELDIYLWKAARQVVTNLIWQACYRKLSLRIELGCIYASYYNDTLIDYVDDDHEELYSVLNLGVQVCTTPSIAYAMIERENAPFKITRTIRDLMNQKPIHEKEFLRLGTKRAAGLSVETKVRQLLKMPNVFQEKNMLAIDFIDDSNLFRDRNLDKIIETMANDKTNLTNFTAKLKIYAEIELIYHGRKGKISQDFSPPGTTPQKSEKQKTLEKLDSPTYYGYTVNKMVARVYSFYKQIGYLLAQVPEKMNSVFKKKMLLFAVEFFIFNCKMDGLSSYSQTTTEHVRYEQAWYQMFIHTMNISSTIDRLLNWLNSDLHLKTKFLEVCRPIYLKYLAVSKFESRQPVVNGLSVNSLHRNATRLLANIILTDANNFSILPIMNQGSSKIDVLVNSKETKLRSVNLMILAPLIRTVVFSQQVFNDKWVRQGQSLKWSNEKYIELLPYCSDTDLTAVQLAFAIAGHTFTEKSIEIANKEEKEMNDKSAFSGFTTSKYSQEEKLKLTNKNFNETLNKQIYELLNYCSFKDGLIDKKYYNDNIDLADLKKFIVYEAQHNTEIFLNIIIMTLEERYSSKVAKNITPELRYKRNLVHFLATGEKKPSELKGRVELSPTTIKSNTIQEEDSKNESLTWENILPKVAEKVKHDPSEYSRKAAFDFVEKFQLKAEYLFWYNPYSKLFINSTEKNQARTYIMNRKGQEDAKEVQKYKPFFTCTASEDMPEFKNGIKNLLLILRHESFLLYNTMLLPLILTYLIPQEFKNYPSEPATKKPEFKPCYTDPNSSLVLYDLKDIFTNFVKYEKSKQNDDTNASLSYTPTALKSTFIEQVLFILTILLREHCEQVDARAVFEKYEIIKLLNAMCSTTDKEIALSEDHKSYCSYIIKQYYNVTGELPSSMTSSYNRQSSTSAADENEARIQEQIRKRKEKAKKARMAIQMKMKKKQKKAASSVINFEEETGHNVEKIVDNEETEAKKLKEAEEDNENSLVNAGFDISKVSGCDFYETLNRPLANCVICKNDCNLDEECNFKDPVVTRIYPPEMVPLSLTRIDLKFSLFQSVPFLLRISVLLCAFVGALL